VYFTTETSTSDDGTLLDIRIDFSFRKAETDYEIGGVAGGSAEGETHTTSESARVVMRSFTPEFVQGRTQHDSRGSAVADRVA